MATPNSKATFKEYIKRALGAPVLEINVDDDQFDDRIDECPNCKSFDIKTVFKKV